MNIEVKNMSYMDYSMSRYEVEKFKIGVSVLIVWGYIIYDMNHKNPGVDFLRILREFLFPAFFLAIAINLLVYIVVYFYKYKKALKINPVIKAQVTDNLMKNFYFFGEKEKYSMRKYSEFAKIYEKRNGFYFNLIGKVTFFIPKKGISDEEKNYLVQIVEKNKKTKNSEKTNGNTKLKKK